MSPEAAAFLILVAIVMCFGRDSHDDNAGMLVLLALLCMVSPLWAGLALVGVAVGAVCGIVWIARRVARRAGHSHTLRRVALVAMSIAALVAAWGVGR